MLSYYLIYYEKLKKVMQRTEKVALQMAALSNARHILPPFEYMTFLKYLIFLMYKIMARLQGGRISSLANWGKCHVVFMLCMLIMIGNILWNIIHHKWKWDLLCSFFNFKMVSTAYCQRPTSKGDHEKNQKCYSATLSLYDYTKTDSSIDLSSMHRPEHPTSREKNHQEI